MIHDGGELLRSDSMLKLQLSAPEMLKRVDSNGRR